MTTTDDIIQRIAALLAIPRDRITPDAGLTDLVADSFRLVELAIELQEDYQVILGQADLIGLTTVGQLAALVASRVVT